MVVVATAGHVDHGKSTLVRLLTGTEPDRWALERERGLTIDLGYAWTDLDGQRVSLVDVPGHEHFTGNMLAGLAPVGAVMFVVAADDGWCAQSQEHARAIAALGIAHVLLVVTRCDRVDGTPAEVEARERLAALGIPVADCVQVSGRTGDGLPRLRAALGRLASESAGTAGSAESRGLASAADSAGGPAATPGEAPIRLWLDRSFTVRGAGTVVTGTLQHGTIRTGDGLVLRDRRVTVRGLQAYGEQVDDVTGPSRVAVNLRGVGTEEVSRGDALLGRAWPSPTVLVDVAVPDVGPRLPRVLTLHVGTAALPVRTQRLTEGRVRLRLARPVPLVPGDRAVLRDPGLHEVLAGVEVAVVDPPTRRERRAASRRSSRSAPAAPDRPAPAPGRTEAQHGIPALTGWLAAHPLQAPARDDLAAWSLTPSDLAEAERRGEVYRVSGLVLAGDVLTTAERVVRQLPQPFSVGAATRALGTSRRIAIPLLERLDSALVTRRLPDGRREVRLRP